jgi:hypothetical protein
MLMDKMVEVNSRIYHRVDIIENERGEPIVLWKSRKDVGGCTVYVWKEWAAGVNLKRRRSCPVLRWR